MKSPVAILLAALLMAGHTFAQYAPIKQRARDASEKTTERQNATAEGAPPPGPGSPYARYGPRPGQPPGAPPAEPAQPAAPVAPAAPVKPSTQQTAATKLKTDIAEARGKTEATADMKKQFVQDLGAAAQGRCRPSSGSLTRFGESLLTTVVAKPAAPADDAKLVKALVVSLNSAGLPAARSKEINDEVRAMLTKSGVTEAEASLVAQNLGAVVSDIQSAAPN